MVTRPLRSLLVLGSTVVLLGCTRASARTPASPLCGGSAASAVAEATKAAAQAQPLFPTVKLKAHRCTCFGSCATQITELDSFHLTAEGLDFQVSSPAAVRTDAGLRVAPLANEAEAKTVAETIRAEPLTQRLFAARSLQCLATTNAPAQLAWFMCAEHEWGSHDPFGDTPAPGERAVVFERDLEAARSTPVLIGYSVDSTKLADDTPGWSVAKHHPAVAAFVKAHPNFEARYWEWHHYFLVLADGKDAITVMFEELREGQRQPTAIEKTAPNADYLQLSLSVP